MLLSLVRALVASGDVDAARAAITRHLVRANLTAERRSVPSNNLHEAVLFEAVGQRALSYATSHAMCREGDVSLIDWSRVENAGAVRAALTRMRAKLGGRDICIFGRGPSMKDLEADPGRLAGHDFVPFVLSEFREVAERVLAKTGKTPGLVCMTSHDVVRAVADDLRALYASDDFIALTIPDFLEQAVRADAQDRTLLDNADRVFVYRAQAELSLPVPSDPLHFPTINTLLHALGLAILLAPRRIFLFGFDGQAAPSGEHYYAEEYKAAYMGQGWQDRTTRWLWWDSFRFNHVAPCFINHLQLLHDVPYPLIYNVSQHSAITCFPRLDLDGYAALVKDGR
jgi:hypothetical protein